MNPKEILKAYGSWTGRSGALLSLPLASDHQHIVCLLLNIPRREGWGRGRELYSGSLTV